MGRVFFIEVKTAAGAGPWAACGSWPCGARDAARDHPIYQRRPPGLRDLGPLDAGDAAMTAPTFHDALDFLRLNAIAEAADHAAEFAEIVSEAALRSDRLRVRIYAGLLSRAARNVLMTIGELGCGEVRA